MPVQIQIDPIEADARAKTLCLGCFGEKQIGLVVCWTCFKNPENGTIGYKFYNGSLTQWLLIANP